MSFDPVTRRIIINSAGTSGGTDTNFAITDLTFTGYRTHTMPINTGFEILGNNTVRSSMLSQYEDDVTMQSRYTAGALTSTGYVNTYNGDVYLSI